MSDLLDAADPLQSNAIRVKVKNIFEQLKNIDTDHKQLYEADPKWLDYSLDKLILTLQARRIASGFEMNFDDRLERIEYIKKCSEIITNQLVGIIECSIITPSEHK